SRHERRGSASVRKRNARAEAEPGAQSSAPTSTRGSQGGGRGGRRRGGDQSRLIVLAAVGVVALAAIIVVGGWVYTQVLPPRATVASVGDREFTARDAAHRATYNAV